MEGWDGWRSFAPPSVLPDISPTSGEIGFDSRFSQIAGVAKNAIRLKLPISPFVGEMPGRAEGGGAAPPYD
ncbi:hypothetical protein EN750_38110, partial [Mesorhizobium sp. M7A.F.Ca.ET.027.03.2.1]